MLSNNLLQAFGALALVAGGTGSAGAAAEARTVRYLNGGAVAETLEAIDHRPADYNLRLVFSQAVAGPFHESLAAATPARPAQRARASGPRLEYVSGLRLAITDAQGRPVLSLGDAGPRTDARLPPGLYHLRAELDDLHRSYTIELKEGQPLDLHVRWPAAHHAA